jgi:ribonucleoside-diphosphate reductase alpha chain
MRGDTAGPTNGGNGGAANGGSGSASAGAGGGSGASAAEAQPAPGGSPPESVPAASAPGTTRAAAEAFTDEPPVTPAKLQGLDLGPACGQCGGMMQRTGSCYTCSSCGNNTGCG